mgnify:CR=1 FL=1
MNIYQVLGISPTKDKKVIRKAYAGLIRKYHPEEHPEKWKEIHDAYTIAMQRADQEEVPAVSISKPKNEEQRPQREEQKPQHEEQTPQQQEQNPQEKNAEVRRKSENRKGETKQPEEDLFGNLEELTETAKKERQEERQSQLKAAIEQLHALCKPKKLQFLQWKEFFRKEEYQWAVRQGEFLYELANCLKGHVMGRRLYHFLLEQIQIIENDNRVSGEVPKRQGAYDAYRMVRMELETNYQRNHPAVQKILLFVLLLAIAGTVLFSFKWKAGKADRQSEADQMVDREYVEEYYENILPDEMTENILKMLDLMNTDQKTELLKMGEPIADGIYVLGNEEQVRLGISAIVMENKTVAEDRERDVPSCEVKVLLDPNGYAFEVQAQEEEKLILYCDPEKLTGCRSADIYYDGKNGYVKYGNRLQNEEQESDRYVHEALGYPVFFVVPGEKICVMLVGDE